MPLHVKKPSIYTRRAPLQLLLVMESRMFVTLIETLRELLVFFNSCRGKSSSLVALVHVSNSARR